MALKFGTSGVRGLVTEMTDRECYLFARAFLRFTRSQAPVRQVLLAGDFRSSTPRIFRAIARAIAAEGCHLEFAGPMATPAVMLAGMAHTSPSIMVTGSHIPDDRNGIKFNLPAREVLKNDEAAILAEYEALKPASESAPGDFDAEGALRPDRVPALPEPDGRHREAYLRRYLDFFPADALRGRKVVVYQHSSVSRDLLVAVLEGLGARVVPVGWSDRFIAIDTEAVGDTDRLARWVFDHSADALISTDGDGDRPLLVDDTGRVVPGDILGLLVADYLGADSVSVPVSCNSSVEACGRFADVRRTRIGSPYVIVSLQEALAAGSRRVVGFEANGGFLTATPFENARTGAILTPLPTRDALLPLLAALVSSVESAAPLSQMRAQLPAIYTDSGLLRRYPVEVARSVVQALETAGLAAADQWFRSRMGPAQTIDFTDGARIRFESGEILHLRPSGNAPEFRCYAEAASQERAHANSQAALEWILQHFPRE